ncbi:MAG: UGSC family (seleno)protein, partial [Planctomycetota bacterium]|nr:UGSC family (seleno)protein [Planctomycetota bacterium]
MLETQHGIPTASMQTDAFETAVKQSAFANGLPNQQFVFVPQPVMGKSPAELRAYVDGDDPVTGRAVMAEVVEALTSPLTDEEKLEADFERSTPRLAEEDTEDNLHRLFLENHWTDKLPIVLPTEERVDAMLAGTRRDRNEIIGKMRPASTREAWEYTVEKVAVNAVMAGARPEYFPAILALASTEVSARASTTTSAAAMVVVNGPIRREIGMNWETGAMAPYNHANATIGRAYGLLSQNLQGGSQPGKTYLGSQGNNYAYNSITFAENEERSPWNPFHVQHGFQANESVASVFGGCWSTSFQLGLRETHWREHVRNLLRGMNPHLPPTLLLDPITARHFIGRGGFDTKEKLIQWIHDNATME